MPTFDCTICTGPKPIRYQFKSGLDKHMAKTHPNVQIEEVKVQPNQPHCSSCSCYKPKEEQIDTTSQQPAKTEQKKHSRYNVKDTYLNHVRDLKYIEYLPSRILDLSYNVRHQLTVIDDKYKSYNISKIPLLNQYETQPLDLQDRVTFGHPLLLNKCNMYDYKFDKYAKDDEPTIASKLSCKKELVGVTGKLMCENNITFEYPEIKGIFWDIETGNTRANHTGVPQWDDPCSFISMLCAVRGNHVKIWILTKYTYDQNKIELKLKEKSDKTFTFEPIQCEDDVEIARGFVSWLASLKSFHYLTGFNATQGKEDKSGKSNRLASKCYDMNFIIEKAQLDKNLFRMAPRDWTNQSEIAYASFLPLPLILLVDFKQLTQSEVALRESELKGYKLDNILELLGAPQKIEHDHEQMKRDSNVDEFDMSHYMAYCAYDCIGLQIVDEKLKLFEQLYEVVKTLRLPISTISSMSDAQKLTIRVLRDFYDQGYSFSYSYLQYIEQQIKNGAFTRAVADSSNKYKYIPKVGSCDYASQYPNAMLQMRISPENISQEVTEFCVDINFDKGEPILVYFKNETTVISVLLKQYLSLKVQAKKNGWKTLEKVYKLIVNTLYGILNQSKSPLYSYKAASAVCAFGRISINLAMDLFKEAGYSILSVDTDGLEIYVPEGQVATKSMQEVAQLIKDKYEYFTLEIQENFEAIFNGKRKAYLLRKEGTQFTAKDLKSLKGFGSKNSLKPYMRGEIIRMCNVILDSQPKKHSDICDQIALFKAYTENCILTDIAANKSISNYTLFHKYTKGSSKTGKMTKSGKLEERHGHKSVYDIVPYNFNDKLQYENFVEYNDKLDTSKIMVDKLVESLIAPLVVFFEERSKTKILESEQKEGQIMVRREPGMVFKNVYISDIPNLIHTHQNQYCYHEKLLEKSTECKLYFDVETKRTKDKPDDDLVIVNVDKLKGIITSALQQSYPIHIANGCIENIKQSYHIVVDVIMTRPQMETLARYINKQYGYYVCDLAVYKSVDQSMRLPQQYKCKDGRLEKTLLQITTNSSIKDFIIQNTTSNHVNICNHIAFTNKTHFGMNAFKKGNKKAVQYLTEVHNLPCTIVKEYILVPNVKPYKCPISGRLHDSQNLKLAGDKIACFSEHCKNLDCLQIPVEEVKPYVYKQVALKGAQVFNTKDVVYNMDRARFTFIKSQMGTGKTKHLITELKKVSSCYQIVISFRRTFATDFAQKSGFENYQLLKSSICLKEHPKIVIQIDSLHRIRLDQIDKSKIVLILDEFESLLDQSAAFSEKPMVQQSFVVLHDLVQTCHKVVAMDALLQNRSIWLLNMMAKNDNFQILHNQYQPKKGKKLILIQAPKTNRFKADFQQAVIAALLTGKKVVSFCSSMTLASGLVQMAERLGFKVKFYHGTDVKQEKCHNGQNMRTAKLNDFEDVENLTCDLLIFTSTLTAGVSYEKKHFNSSINYYTHKTNSVVSTIQAMNRVRNITDDHVTLYNSVTQIGSIYQTAQSLSQYKTQIYQTFNVYDAIRQLTIYLDARMNEQIANKNRLLFDFLADQGYDIETIVDKEYTRVQVNEVQVKYDYSVQLVEEDLKLKELVKSATFLINNNTPNLADKVHLVHLYSLYKSDTFTLEQFNQTDVIAKEDLFKQKESRIEILAWQALAKTGLQSNQKLTVEQAIDAARLHEQKINIDSNWKSEIQQQITLKQRDVYIRRIEYLNHCIVMKSLSYDDLQQYMSAKGSQFIKSFNTTIQQQFGYSLISKQQMIEGARVRTYTLIKPE